MRKRKNIPTVYSKLIKTLYETVDTGKPFHSNLSKLLENDLGFIKNPYDNCVTNNTIYGTQYTVLFHVDGPNNLHKDPAVVTSVIKLL